jgi:trimethylamine:corrinoid methyltransferase-like protein
MIHFPDAIVRSPLSKTPQRFHQMARIIRHQIRLTG